MIRKFRTWAYKLIGGKLIDEEIRAESIGYNLWVTSLQKSGFPHNTKGTMMDCWQLYDYYVKSNKRDTYKKHGSIKTNNK